MALKLNSTNNFRQKLVLAIFASRPVIISNIRPDEDGIADFEVSFLEFLVALTDGTQVHINETGTRLKFYPGRLTGGKVEFTCHPSRSIGYYLEYGVMLGPFGREPLNLTLRGTTNDQHYYTVERIKRSCLPIMSKFLGSNEGLVLTVEKRAMAPEGGGVVSFKCPTRRQLKPLSFTDQGRFQSIRGLAYTSRVAPTFAPRAIEAAKKALPEFISDVYIKNEHGKKGATGKSPGFGLCLVAESTTGVFVAAEKVSNPIGGNAPPSVPEDLGQEAAEEFLQEIWEAGCVDSAAQALTLLYMALCPRDVSRILMPSVDHLGSFIEDIKIFLQVSFKQDKVDEERAKGSSDKVIMTCLGSGFTNISRPAF